MNPTEIAATLSDLGGWTAFVAVVVAVAFIAWRSFKSGDIVPGYAYRQAIKERDDWQHRSVAADDALERLSDKIEAVLRRSVQ